ncbi:MAG: prolyl oligopeptidase family serine peptidase, partial [Wenzhouxiangellaceae bacterium]
MKSALISALLVASSLTMANEDPYLWLEEVEGPNALSWARGMNELSLAELEAHPLFDEIHARALEILTSDERIAYPSLMGGEVYNFWRDAEHVRGIWRKTALAEYRSDDRDDNRDDNRDWDVILDIDELAAAEEENWVWAGSGCRYPDYDRCLVGLSIGGADAAVRREFDLETRRFVDDGFVLPESKSRIGWRDRDSVFYGPAFSDDEMTDSGYPRTVRIWRRGTAPEDSELVFEGEKDDVSAFGMRIWDGEDYFDLVVRSPGFFSRHYFHYDEGELERIRIPDDAQISGLLDGQLLVQLKSDWQVGDTTFAQGALIAGPMESFLGDTPRIEVVFQPDERASISRVATTESTVIVTVLDNVVSRLVRFTHDGEGWHEAPLDAPAMGSIGVVTADDKSDRFFYNYTGFLTPSTLYEADAMADTHVEVRSEPAWFESEGMEVAQYETTSADGETIPYFVVTPPGFEADGRNPTLISAYGGFEVSRTPSYSGLTGSAWLERGGVYVLANIRGGGEFGPKWHQAGLKENRQRVFDDLIAVSEDVIERGITSPEHLGIQGGSNGGLLVGAVMVQRPDLYNAVVCQVPLLDMKRYHKLLAGASWMAEYGDPDDPEQWDYISRYSPYQNVSDQASYPRAFFTTSTRDDRVHPAHARKMVAKMLDQGHDLLYYENIEGGHG